MHTRDKLSSKSEQDIWISGATAGGLVGRCGYDLTVRNSFASSVLEGGRYAGGLVGYISGTRTVYVEHSYADCYLYASGTTGGLIVDTECRVLTKDRQPIPGLFAAGITSGGMFYNTYPHNLNCLSHTRNCLMGYTIGQVLGGKQ